jgi:magnesium chelatase family protein
VGHALCQFVASPTPALAESWHTLSPTPYAIVRTFDPMLARVATFAIDGVDPRQVWVEVDIRPGLPTFTIVGLGDAAVRESRDRARAAIFNSGFKFPDQRVTANLAPAFLRKAGPGFDTALALAVLAASGQVPRDELEAFAVFGELSLSGEIRDSPGALAVAEGARRAGIARLIVPRERAREAALVDGVAVVGVSELRQAAAIVAGADPPPLPGAPDDPPPLRAQPDLSDVRGQAAAMFALQVAAAGGHNLLMEGAPGTGKTMLARRLPSILPEMTRAEALEVTRIHSIAGAHADGLITERPFRAPHHTISPAGLVGGGSPPRPGEASLATHGVLFLDELSEFQRGSLDALRQPLEDGSVAIVRGQRALVFPTRFMLIAATNPCPCGFAGVDDRCACGEADLRRHQRRMSGPLLDRMDLLVDVRRLAERELRAPPSIASAEARAVVSEARERQRSRFVGTGVSCNGEMDVRLVRRHVRLDEAGDRALAEAYEVGVLSARGRHRVLRVARTIADLEHHERVTRADVLVALGLRQRAGGAGTAMAA